MDGRMMHVPLRVTPFLARAERYFGARELVTRTAQGVHRTRWSEIGERARRLASSLAQLGLAPFERVATLAWNTHRHVELYYAVPGAGLVLHTLNLRLHADQLAWIATHADDRVIFVDDSLVPLLESIAPKLPHVRAYVLMGDGPLPRTTLAPAYRY
ncbi:MAG: AMP-binding protein, partial [Solirubrobacteraceae bacterium]